MYVPKDLVEKMKCDYKKYLNKKNKSKEDLQMFNTSIIAEMVKEDLKKFNLMYKSITEELNAEDVEEFNKMGGENLFGLLIGTKSRYSSLINNFPDDFIFIYDDTENNDDIIIYLKNVINKLTTFEKMGYRETFQTNYPNISIHNENTNKNINDISNNFTSIQNVKQHIENMSSLNDSEIEDILQKIDELEKIINSADRKSKKWENAKEIVKWVADKSFDVAKSILPIILKIE